eukprot:SAG22_NODE_6_length_41368_cov_49.702222_2_plen_535_part_00
MWRVWDAVSTAKNKNPVLNQASDMMVVQAGGQYSHGIRIVSGGSAAIYEATKPLTGELLVAKVHTDKAGFQNEVEKMRLFLGRPYLDSIIQFKDMNGPNLTIYMERGESDLRHVMKTEDISAVHAKGILEQVLKALNLIHTRGFVHCDLKPDNVLVFGRRVKVADLDGVTNKGAQRSDDITPTICAPELARGLGKGQPTHEAEDIWAVGVLAFELLYQRHPFLDGRTDRDEILAQIARVDFAAVSNVLGANASGQQRSFLAQCFETDPTKRAGAAKLIQSGFISGDTSTQTVRQLGGLSQRIDQIDTTMQMVISNMVPKLPVPYDFSVVNKMNGAQKQIRLHFMCGVDPDTTMTTTSTEWSKWLRLGVSAVQAGRTVVKLASGDVTELQNVAGWKEKFDDSMEIVKSLRGCHDALVHEPGSDRFATFVETVHFTSEEADSVIKELRAAKFYDRFEYDPTVPGGWRSVSAVNAEATRVPGGNVPDWGTSSLYLSEPKDLTDNLKSKVTPKIGILIACVIVVIIVVLFPIIGPMLL